MHLHADAFGITGEFLSEGFLIQKEAVMDCVISITDRFKQKHYFLHFYPHLECIIHVLNFTSFNNYGIQNPKEWFFNKESTVVYSHDFFPSLFIYKNVKIV